MDNLGLQVENIEAGKVRELFMYTSLRSSTVSDVSKIERNFLLKIRFPMMSNIEG